MKNENNVQVNQIWEEVVNKIEKEKNL